MVLDWFVDMMKRMLEAFFPSAFVSFYQIKTATGRWTRLNDCNYQEKSGGELLHWMDPLEMTQALQFAD